YFEAVALALSGEYQEALDVMQTAETELEKQSARDITLYTPLVNLGFAEVYVQQAIATRNNSTLGQAQQRLKDGIELNPRLARAQLLLAESYSLQGEYASAIKSLDDAMALPELANDMTLILGKGQIYLTEGSSLMRQGSQSNGIAQLEKADYQAFYALYINPYEETAHQLRIQSALERNLPGLAVLYCQTYLLYYPDSPAALRLLGDARQAEENTDLALQAYSQALNSGEDSPLLVDPLLSRAQFYQQRRRYDLALVDYSRALKIQPDQTVQVQRMLAAYAAGDLDTAQSDSEALMGSGVVSDDQLRFIQARIIMDQAPDNARSVYQSALDLLGQIQDSALTPDDAAIANQYRASANFKLDNLDAARQNIDTALSLGETGTRHYLSGQIYEAQGNLTAAAHDYEWIETWNPIYSFAFMDDVTARLTDIRQQLADAVEATSAAVEATATAEAAGTPTEEPTP
ncbi:MAG TPA: tetratricopeptide repeat protein, partial [Phototrophicaceae bacterium]|nr:tetratricopeptide repeat protein [Phototrophicaceae bacterium]